ncbi:MAG: hypothetical protein FJ278_04390, partial [Planctomycetes bacterium]|nr:hypothetical protein [Planctomycetota bacterium]
MTTEATTSGRIAVFKDNVPVVGTASQPDYLAKTLRDAGFSVTMLSAADLADKAKLSPQAVDVVVLPYGASFPLAAAENFRAFLMAGGSFLSMGGYALDNLYGGETDSRFDNVLRCPSLEEDDAGMFWLPPTKPDPSKAGPDIRIVPSPARTGKRSLMIHVPDATQVTWYVTGQKVEKPAVGKGYTVSCYIKTEDVRDGHGAYLAVNYLDADGKRISFQNEGFTLGNTDWRQAKFIARVPAKATHLTVVAVMHGHGTA